MNTNFLEINKVSKFYKDKHALNNVTIHIKKGCIYGLIGQNGAGKTSLIRIINKIIDLDEGEILLEGKPMSNDLVAKIGYLPEERGLYKNMTIESQALYFAQLKGMTKSDAEKSLNVWLEKFNMLSWKKKKIQQLSKGMAQKVQFITTVIHQPELLILDEPFSGFDPVNANLIANEIKNLAKNGTTIIFSSHRMESVEEMCDEITLIHHGNVLLQGSIPKIKKDLALKTKIIELDNTNTEALQLFCKKNNYTVTITESGLTKIVIPAETKFSNHELINLCVEFGNLISFKEVYPTLQQIFINTITNA